MPLKELLLEEDFKYGLNIDYTGKQNLIQISTTMHAILWDVQRNQQVESNLDSHERWKIKDFVPSQFKLMDLSQASLPSFGKSFWYPKKSKEYISTLANKVCRHDKKNLLFSLPPKYTKQKSCLFQTYSVYNLNEIREYFKQPDRKNVQFEIDTILAIFRSSSTLN